MPHGEKDYHWNVIESAGKRLSNGLRNVRIFFRTV